jgi:hypothetical protein
MRGTIFHFWLEVGGVFRRLYQKWCVLASSAEGGDYGVKRGWCGGSRSLSFCGSLRLQTHSLTVVSKSE